MHNNEKNIDRHLIMSTVENLNRDIIASLEELNALCEDKISELDIVKLKDSLIPKLKLVLHGLQNRKDTFR